MKQKPGLWIALWVILVVVTGFLAFGHGYGGRGYGPGYGWSHMGGWGDRYSEEDSRGWRGYGRGMTGDADAGYGWGMGSPHGMMGQYGFAGGEYGVMPFLPQNLTTDQAKKLVPLQSENEKSQLNLQQQRRELLFRLNSLYENDKRDWNAIRETGKALSDLQRKQMDAVIEMQQKIDGLLSDNQRQAMMRSWRDFGRQGGR